MEKMKDKLSKTMKGEVEASLAKETADGKERGSMKATRFLISLQKEMRMKKTTTSTCEGSKEDSVTKKVEAVVGADDLNEDPYDSAEPFSVLKALDKPSTDEDIPKFWEAVVSSNWRHRLHALKQLTDACSSSARLQKEEFMELQKMLKKVISKDANANCVAEASKSIVSLGDAPTASAPSSHTSDPSLRSVVVGAGVRSSHAPPPLVSENRELSPRSKSIHPLTTGGFAASKLWCAGVAPASIGSLSQYPFSSLSRGFVSAPRPEQPGLPP
jgi:hypothetical protein